MSYVIAVPDALGAVATDLTNIGSTLNVAMVHAVLERHRGGGL